MLTCAQLNQLCIYLICALTTVLTCAQLNELCIYLICALTTVYISHLCSHFHPREVEGDQRLVTLKLLLFLVLVSVASPLHISISSVCPHCLLLNRSKLFIHSTTMPIQIATIFTFLGINLPQQQNRMPTTRSAILAILTLVVPLLLDLIELKFQNESISAFEAHPITTKVAIAALQLFGLSFTLEEYFAHLSPTPAALLRTSMVFSGSLLVASLVSILSSDEWRPVIYVIYVFLSLGNYLYRLVRKGCGCVQGIMEQRHVTRRPAILPLTNMDTITESVQIQADP